MPASAPRPIPRSRKSRTSSEASSPPTAGSVSRLRTISEHQVDDAPVELEPFLAEHRSLSSVSAAPGEKGIVIGIRNDENSNPSSPTSAQGPPNFQKRVDSIADVAVDDLEFTEVPTPPDGGYGWVIVLASFTCNMIVDGIAYSFGVFMPEYVEYFKAPVGTVAWVNSLLNGVYLSAGPIVSGLTNVYGFRPVTIAGSLLAGTAFLISTTVPTISGLIVVYGIIGGLGFGLIYLPAIVAVNYYFEARRALATGIAVCGSGVGTFVFAPLASFMLGEFGWKGSHMILAAIIFIGVLCGALMKPLTYKKPKESQKPLLQAMAEDKQRQMKRNSSTTDAYFFVKLPDGTLEKRSKWKQNADPGVHSSLALNEFGRSPSGILPPIAEARNRSSSPEKSSDAESSEQHSSSEVTTPEHQKDAASVVDELKNGEVKTGSSPAKDSEDAGSEKADSEKASDEEKNDTVPDLPSGERGEIARRPSGKAAPRRSSLPKVRGSVPKDAPPASNGAAMPKNVSTPAFDAKRRGSGVRVILRQSASGTALNPDLRRLSHHRRGSSRGGPTSQEDLWLCSNMSVSNMGSRQSLPRPGEMLRPMSRRDVFYSGSVHHLPQYQSQRSLASYRASVLSIPQTEGYEAEPRDPNSWACILPAGCGVLAEMVDTSLLKSPLFLLICASNVFGMLGFYVPFVYIVDAAVMKGVAPEQAAFLLSVIGISNTLGRVISGWVTDFPRVDALFVNNLCLVLSGVCLFLVPACASYASFVTLCVAFGFFVAPFVSLTCMILVDLLGIEKLSNSFGLLILVRGAAGMVGAPLAGAMFDYTGDYNISFFAAGGLLVLSSAISFTVPILRCHLARGSPPGGAGDSEAEETSRSPPPEVVVSDEDHHASPADPV